MKKSVLFGKIIGVVASIVLISILGTSILAIIGSHCLSLEARAVCVDEDIYLTTSIDANADDLLIGASVGYNKASPSQLCGLSDLQKTIYEVIEKKIIDVASGKTTEAAISLRAEVTSLSWTKEELGCEIRNAYGITAEARAAVLEKIEETINFEEIYHRLLVEHPYELFWHDKTSGYIFTYTLTGDANHLRVPGIIVFLMAADDYADVSTGVQHAVLPAEIERANAALPMAQAIVDKHKDKSDLEKLTAYANEICALTSYNYKAAEGYMYYGDPWQSVYVFDGDDTTNVVCEGYAKAFKLLCDLSVFENDVTCYITSGTITRGDLVEPHMWNVVSVNGNNYLADVTLCDDGDRLSATGPFLVGGTTSDNHTSHKVSWNAYDVEFTAIYTHSDDQYGIYTTGYLPLCEEYFHVHDYGTAWYHDEVNHWRECDCGVQEGVSSHDTSTNPATCSQKAICPVCDIEVGEIGDHVFDQCVVDEKHLCNEASCTSPATYYFTCKCGLVGESTFTVGDVYHSYGDDNTCTLCGAEYVDTNVSEAPNGSETTTPGDTSNDNVTPEPSNPNGVDNSSSTPNENNQPTKQPSNPVSDDTAYGVILEESKMPMLLKIIWTILSFIFGFKIKWV